MSIEECSNCCKNPQCGWTTSRFRSPRPLPVTDCLRNNNSSINNNNKFCNNNNKSRVAIKWQKSNRRPSAPLRNMTATTSSATARSSIHLRNLGPIRTRVSIVLLECWTHPYSRRSRFRSKSRDVFSGLPADTIRCVHRGLRIFLMKWSFEFSDSWQSRLSRSAPGPAKSFSESRLTNRCGKELTLVIFV